MNNFMREPRHEYTEGICQDGAAILCDGQPMAITEILDSLRERDRLRAENERLREGLRGIEDTPPPNLESTIYTNIEWYERLIREMQRIAGETLREN